MSPSRRWGLLLNRNHIRRPGDHSHSPNWVRHSCSPTRIFYMTAPNPWTFTEPSEVVEVRTSNPVPFRAGTRRIALAHAAAAFALLYLIWLLWNPGDYHEAFPWCILSLFLFVLARGLWLRRSWARVVAQIMHWPLLVLAVIALLASVAFLTIVPARGIAAFHVFAVCFILTSIPTILLSAGTLWHFHGSGKPSRAAPPDEVTDNVSHPDWVQSTEERSRQTDA